MAVAVLVALAGLGIFMQSRSANNPDTNGSSIPKGASTLGGPIVVGDPGAKTTLTIWEDFQCPYCQRFETAVTPTVQAAIAKKTTKVEYHVVSFLDGGKVSSSNRAANASFCAADQDKFIEFQSWAYAHQPAENSGGFTNDELVGYGPSIGIPNQDAYASCVNDGTYLPFAKASTDSMVPNGIQGTPTVLVNGNKIDIQTTTLNQFAAMLGVTFVPPTSGGSASPSPSGSASPSSSDLGTASSSASPSPSK